MIIALSITASIGAKSTKEQIRELRKIFAQYALNEQDLRKEIDTLAEQIFKLEQSNYDFLGKNTQKMIPCSPQISEDYMLPVMPSCPMKCR